MSIVPKTLLDAHVVVLCTVHNKCDVVPYVEGSKPYDYHACPCGPRVNEDVNEEPCAVRIMQIIGKTAEGRLACLRDWAPLHQWNFKKYTNNAFEFKNFSQHTDDPVFKSYFEGGSSQSILYF